MDTPDMPSTASHSDSITDWCNRWQPIIEPWVANQMATADSGHGLDHVRRVFHNTILVGPPESADPNIYLPAAWLHDCVVVPKNSPQRKQASKLAATCATTFLNEIQYPSQWIDPISHCIEAHSFSANIACKTIEAKVVQDSDRLEAVGAIGLARCLMTGGAMNQRLYHPNDPFPTTRPPADTEQSVDHFFAKLLGLLETMQTTAGRNEAIQRSRFLTVFLKQLALEIGIDSANLQMALAPFQTITSSLVEEPRFAQAETTIRENSRR
jgi:uncharacterized protein